MMRRVAAMRGEKAPEFGGRKVLEKDVQRQILDYLVRRQVWHRRFNTGALPGPHGRPIRFGSPGLPDILVRTKIGSIIWIECKSSTGKLSEDQRKWKEDMEGFGDIYIVARSVEDAMALFEGRKDG